MADRGVDDAGCLLGAGDQFVIDRALVEEAIGVGFLEVHLADLDAGNVRGDSQDGCARALGVIEAIDEVEVSRAA